MTKYHWLNSFTMKFRFYVDVQAMPTISDRDMGDLKISSTEIKLKY